MHGDNVDSKKSFPSSLELKWKWLQKKLIFYATCSRYSAISHRYKCLFPERNSEFSVEEMQ
jgi:hypothetical protein